MVPSLLKVRSHTEAALRTMDVGFQGREFKAINFRSGTELFSRPDYSG